MKSLLLILFAFLFVPVHALAADVSQEEQKLSMRTLLDPSVLIARRTSLVGRLYWDVKDKSVYEIGTPSEGRPSSYCLPVLIDAGNGEMTAKVSELNAKDVRIDGIIAYAARDPGSTSITACKQLGIYLISIKALSPD
ncbi:hypothetical protein [Lysobacter sp. CA199]|uniref:hypothetical protein n=1 Tax=Lysobacter sp. CA199 TaxID=3455608 RepID=UPI003F8D2496